MSTLKRIVEEKSKKYVIVRARVSDELLQKIKSICESYPDVKQEEYLGQLLEESEIEKVHKEMNKGK